MNPCRTAVLAHQSVKCSY